MREQEIGGIKVSRETSSSDPWVVSLFGDENVGKTRFGLSAPQTIGYVPLEMKAFKTIERDGAGVKLIKPGLAHELMTSPRVMSALKQEDQQAEYAKHIKKVEDYVYGLLGLDEVRSIVIDKFNTYCNWVEFAINGVTDPRINVDGKYFRPRRELNQHIIDFINSMTQFGKTIVLVNAAKPDYDGLLDVKGNPLGSTWEGFKYLGSHSNLVLELVCNREWNPKKNGEKYSWRYGLNINKCQSRPELESFEGSLILKDDSINLVSVMSVVDPNFDPEVWI